MLAHSPKKPALDIAGVVATVVVGATVVGVGVAIVALVAELSVDRFVQTDDVEDVDAVALFVSSVVPKWLRKVNPIAAITTKAVAGEQLVDPALLQHQRDRRA